MKRWMEQLLSSGDYRALPVLSFPAVQLMNITVRELIGSSERQAEGMQRIAELVPSAAAVSLMDLSVEAECFGANIIVSENEVPTVKGSVLASCEEIENLAIPAIGSGRTGIYIEAIRKAKERIKDRPVFAGMIGPYSLAGRLLDVSEIMLYCYDEPELVKLLMSRVSEFLIAYGKAYREAGADGIVMAEPLTGLLSPAMAEEFSEPFVRQIVEALQDDQFLVIYHNCGNNTIHMIDSILATGAAGYHFGNAIKMKDIMKHIPADRLVMGNIDPVSQFRNGTPDSIRQCTKDVLAECAGHPGFVISSGCDIPPMADWANIHAFFAAAKEFYRER